MKIKMKSYTFKLKIYEGNDEFWETIKNDGCDDVAEVLTNCLAHYGFYVGNNCNLKLVKYKLDDSIKNK
jgi:hypothetical protein